MKQEEATQKLFEAAEAGNARAARAAIAAGADPTAKDETQQTPLHLCNRNIVTR